MAPPAWAGCVVLHRGGSIGCLLATTGSLVMHQATPPRVLPARGGLDGWDGRFKGFQQLLVVSSARSAVQLCAASGLSCQVLQCSACAPSSAVNWAAPGRVWHPHSRLLHMSRGCVGIQREGAALLHRGQIALSLSAQQGDGKSTVSLHPCCICCWKLLSIGLVFCASVTCRRTA